MKVKHLHTCSATLTNRLTHGVLVASLCILLQSCPFLGKSQNLYWAESINNTIKKENVATPPVTEGNATALATPSIPLYMFEDNRNGYVYWSDAGSGTIKRVSTSGGAVTSVVTGISGTGVYARGIYVDVTNNVLYWAQTSPGATDIIEKVSIAGGLPVASSSGTTVVSGIDIVRGITVDTLAGNVYFADAGNKGSGQGIYRASKSGSTTESSAVKIVSLSSAEPNSLFIDNKNNLIYWSDFLATGGINRAGIGGSSFPVTPIVVYSGASVRGISIDPGSNTIYWTQYPSLTVLKASLATIPIVSSTTVVTGLSGFPRSVSIPSTFTIPAPTITSFTPDTAAAGATVTITGTNFTGATAVSFGGTQAISFTVISATSIQAVVGAGTTGSVSVITPGGTAALSGFVFCTPATLSVSIGANTASLICAGTSVTFTATPTNGGATPIYQWYKDNIAVGTNSNTYSTAGLNNGDSVWCVITNNASCITNNTANSNKLHYTVNPIITPSVSIQANNTSPICAGTNVTFTATPTNGGTTPAFHWYQDNVAVGTNSNTYSTTGLNNGDSVWCVVTSNASCITGNTANSNKLYYTVNPTVTPAVKIAPNNASPICAGTNVTFTATPANGGTTPVYQWYQDNVAVGTNSNIYSTSALSNGDSVWCVITSNASCLTANTANSNKLHYTVNPTVTPSVSVMANTPSPICAGTSVTFTATPTNGGASPVFQWYKDNIAVGTNSNTYSTSGLNNGDSVWCVVTSNASCVVTNTAISNKLVYTVTTTIPTPSVSIDANTGNPMCAGATITFTAIPVNGGTAPIYQWYKNSVPVGGNSHFYGDGHLNNGDVISAKMTSKAACIVNPTANSNTINVVIDPLTVPVVTLIATTKDSICTGAKVVFIARVQNAGTAPSYQWVKNGITVGPLTNNSEYTDSLLKNGDSVKVYVTTYTNSACVATNNVVSNILGFTVQSPITEKPVVTGPSAVNAGETGIVFSATGTTSSVYEWAVSAGASIVSGQGTSLVTVNWGNNPGSVVTKATNVCGGSPTNVKPISITTGTPGGQDLKIIPGQQVAKVTLYPNPSADQAHLELSGFGNVLTITIADMTGKVVWQRDKLTNSTYLLPLDQLANGIYFVTVRDGVVTKTIKLVKAK